MYDAVIVGAGHNGLTAAAYLAAAGLNTLVLEARDTVGGAAATQEFAPGFRVSTASYSLSLLRPDIHRDLGLAGRGLEIVPKDPQMFVPLPDGRHFFIWRDGNRSAEEISRIHPGDGIGYSRWNGFWEEAIPLFRKVFDDPEPPSLAEIESHFQRQGRAEMWRLAVAGSAAETVSEFFDSDELRGAFASQGIIGINASPREPGTAWVLTYHYLGGEVCGGNGTWAYVMGGMGALSDTLADVASERGAKIRTSTQADEILVEGERAAGVRLIDGEEIPASVVLSNADPKRTFLDLVPPGALAPEFVKTVDEWRMDGAVVKVNLALSELPEFRGLSGGRVGPEHLGTIEISPSIGYLDVAHREAEAGWFSSRPFMEAFVQSALDPAVAPAGRHVLSAFTQYAPRVGAQVWEKKMKDDAADKVLATLSEHALNVEEAVVAQQVLGPHDLEASFGLTGGDIFHGSILPEQSFGGRFGYRTPIDGLYLCGAGARPGGGVMGAPGRNAARAVINDLSGSTEVKRRDRDRLGLDPLWR